MRIYSNENFYQSVATILRELGHDVLTSHEAGQANKSISDIEVLRYATNASRILVTLNRRDFILLHRSFPNHAGIIVCTEDKDFNSLAMRIDKILKENESMYGKLMRVTRPNI